jgi:hypothetical protein
MLQGLVALPLISKDDLTDEKVTEFLTSGREVLRMLQEDSSETDDKSARELYDTYFTLR